MMFKKLTATILSVIMLISIPAIGIEASFVDINDENVPLAQAVDFLLESGITKGVSETEFGENQNVTRQQMAAFIYRAKNNGDSPEGGENNTPFTDLDDSTFYSMISWANENGIIKGVSATEFEPNGGITLQDAYTMLIRALGHEKDTSFTYPDDYISKALEIGLDKNINASLTSKLKRGEVAIVLHNAFGEKSIHMLDGKKIIFIGNSFTYYSKTVIDALHNLDDEGLLKRFDDKGYFYQLCAQNGANVSVTNWTWGGHGLADIFGGSCSADRGHDGHDHLADLKRLCDMNYDYVVIQPGSRDTAVTTPEWIKKIQELFRAVNPETKFVYNIHSNYYRRGNDDDKLLVAGIDSTAKECDLTVANWGVIVYDIISGVAKVENATQEYNKNSFIITKSKSDGYHPNMLSGYITTQVVYSAITGEKALGEDYSFCTDPAIHAKFSVQEFLDKYYTYDNLSNENSETKLVGDELTNFPEVFDSPADMAGIQKLIDTYLSK